MSQENIADASKPNAGRMYDYYLGGSHNFEVDRQAADQILKLLPFVSKYARLQRWTLQDIAEELSQNQGYDIIVDFASGLPTEDHIHHNVRAGTTVIYSDYDPITVEYAHEILGDTPNVYFIEADATAPEKLLNNPQIKPILDGQKKIAFVMWGVSAFLSDDEIAHAVRYLYDWSGSDSCLAFNVKGINRDDPTAQKFIDFYK
ncbi:MAG: SAM-dependent methyltransferase, partial [Anaerolineae bacterium]|nr:SAM-dependent methyltransferase [Anaerolineae bacterium]